MRHARWLLPAILLLGASLAFPFAPALKAQPAGGYRTVTIAHGVKLSLIVPKRAYPLNALVRVTVVVENITHHRIVVQGADPTCGFDNPLVQVVDRQGMVVYPPARPGLVPNPCPPFGFWKLAAGKSIKRKMYVILRAETVRPIVDLMRRGAIQEPPAEVVGRGMNVSLIAGEAPHVTLSAPNEPVAARLRPATPVKGPLLFIDTFSCPVPRGRDMYTEYPWRTMFVPILAPPCGHPEFWRAVAGWVGQPVVYIDYPSPPNPPPPPGLG